MTSKKGTLALCVLLNGSIFSCLSFGETISDTSENDTLYGTNSADTIYAQSGSGDYCLGDWRANTIKSCELDSTDIPH